MNPEYFHEKNYDSYLFTLENGKVLHRDQVQQLLRDAALGLGLPAGVVAPHSLRAGGCSAMYNAGFAEHEIQRRGRWVTACWKIYAWAARRRDTNVANRMAAADSNLMAMA